MSVNKSCLQGYKEIALRDYNFYPRRVINGYIGVVASL